MNSSVCTLFDGHYHFGLGALVNSLYQNGFRGIVWAGYRGELPFWAINAQSGKRYNEFHVGEGCAIRFIKVETKVHLANYKPQFMLKVFREFSSEVSGLVFFDSDIVIKCRWSFYEEWMQRGIALCADGVYTHCPADHPLRFSWLDYAEHKQLACVRRLSIYYNSGFVGVSKQWSAALEIWQDLLEGLPEIGVDLHAFMPGDRTQAFYVPDQDTLNIMAMVTEYPISTVGPEGMDFAGGGYIMSHAPTGAKPWRKHILREALNGKAPTLADKVYWQNVETPIQLYPPRHLSWKRFCLRCGAAIGRFIRRS